MPTRESSLPEDPAVTDMKEASASLSRVLIDYQPDVSGVA